MYNYNRYNKLNCAQESANSYFIQWNLMWISNKDGYILITYTNISKYINKFNEKIWGKLQHNINKRQ